MSIRNTLLTGLGVCLSVVGPASAADPTSQPVSQGMATAAATQVSTVTINVNAGTPSKNMSPLLYGLFFEEISNAGDGGLYAELIKNRSFEQDTASWSLVKTGSSAGSMAVNTTNLLNAAQTKSIKLSATSVASNERVGLSNEGYWGINVTPNTSYQLTFYAKAEAGYSGPLKVSLENTAHTKTYAQNTISGLTTDWNKFTCTLTSDANSDPKGCFVVSTATPGTLYFDVVSLFPPTFKDRPNGLRLDLANLLNDTKPKFVRFPGGCYAEGQYLVNRFNWKESIGDIAERPGHAGYWTYSTDGLGYHEYLQMCEDFHAEPLFVINCGMSHNENVPVDQIGTYVQDALDAVEYANGAVTTYWGAKRAANGHPEPFNLKYLEIGNEENFFQSEYDKRYPAFYAALKAAYPDLNLICNSNSIPGSTVDFSDHHNYYAPTWAFKNTTAYDGYNRSGPKVFLGEYLGNSGKMLGALADGAFLTGLERNSDIVKLSCAAPLFANYNNTQWNPNLIYYNSANVVPTAQYYVQKMYSSNLGDAYLSATDANNGRDPVTSILGKFGVGTESSQVEFDNVVITSGDNTTLFSDDFTAGASNWTPVGGTWGVVDGVYRQTSYNFDIRSYANYQVGTGTYSISLKARKTDGSQGIMVYFGADSSGGYYRWNIGAWGNSNSAIESTMGGTLTGKLFKINTNQWYDVRMDISGNHVICTLDGTVMHDFYVSYDGKALNYAFSKDNETGDIIVKIANIEATARDAKINLQGIDSVSSTGEVTVLSSADVNTENDLTNPARVAPVTSPLTGLSTSFDYIVPAYSVNVLRIATGQGDTAPTISNIADQTTHLNTATGAIPFTIGDAETAAASLTVTGSSSNTALVPNANIVFGGSGTERTVTVTPASNHSGLAVITLTVSDGVITATDTFVLTVIDPNNTAPTISDVADQSTNQDAATGAIPFTVGDTETAAAALTVSGTSSNTTLVPNANIVFGGSGADRTVTITPASNQFGTATITLTVSDGSRTATDTFVLTVNAVINTVPTISDVADQSTNEDTATSAIPFMIGDGQTAVASLTVTGASSNTTLVPNANIVFGGSGANRTVTVTPASNQYGTATITLTVTDSGGLTATDTFVLTVTPVNDAPTISDVPSQSVQKDITTSAIPFTVGDVDNAADSLTVTSSSSNTAVVLNSGIVLGGSGTSRTVTITPVSGVTGTTTITLTVGDGTLSASDTFDLTVTSTLIPATYTWNQPGSLASPAVYYSWITPANWTPNSGYPNGTNHTAILNTSTNDMYVTLDAPITLGGISSATGTLNISGGPSGGFLTFDNGNGIVDTVNFSTALRYRLQLGANLVLNDNLNLTYSSVNNSSSPYIQGVVSGAGGLTVNYTSTATLSLGAAGGAANTHQGGTTLAGGGALLRSMSAAKANVVGSGPLSLDRISLQIATFAQTFAGLNGGANSAVLTASGTPAVTLNGSDSYAYSGVIAGGISLAKSGAGTQVLSGTNTYTGATTVTGGSLLVNGSLASGSAVTVVTTGTLGGTGIINGAITNGGTIAPGSGGIGALTAGAVTLSAGSAAQIEFSNWTGSTAGTHWDTLNCASLALSGTTGSKITLKLVPSSLANFSEASKTFTIATSAAAITGFSVNSIAIDSTSMPGAGTWAAQLDTTGKLLQVAYTPSAGYTSWQGEKFTPEQIGTGLASADADPDHDGYSNLAEFAFNGDPLSASSKALVVTEQKDTGTDGNKELVFTCAVRRGAVFSANGNNAQVSAAIDGVIYRIEATADLGGSWNAAVTPVGSASNTPPAGSGLPVLTSGWEYRTFSSFNGLAIRGFMRAVATQP